MQQEKEEFYNMIKQSGELFIFFDDMTGNWEEDKESFCKNYDDTMSSLKNTSLDEFKRNKR